MVDIKTDWNEQNLKEYVKYTIFSRNKTSKLALISLAVCCGFVFAFSLVLYFAFDYAFGLVFAGLAVLLSAGFAAFFTFNISSCTKRILKANGESELNRVMISEDDIIAFNGDEPIGTIPWSRMADIYFNEKSQTAYLTTEGNAALILECSKILSGNAEELKEIIGKKRDELSELAKKA